MFYFIPSWNNQNSYVWDNTPVRWYSYTKPFNFDETMSQIRMLQRAGENPTVVILEYSPNLKTFLCIQEIPSVKVLNIFDFILDTIHVRETRMDWKQLRWPKHCEYIYTPFSTLVYQGGMKIGEVELDRLGRLSVVYRQKDEMIEKKYIFDDRGFLSSIIYYDMHNHPVEQVFLTLSGDWSLKIDLQSDNQSVEINPVYAGRFKRLHYTSILELIQEYLQEVLNGYLKKDDVLIMASNAELNDLVLEIATPTKKVLTFFDSRDYNFSSVSENLWSNIDFAISDTQRVQKQLKEKLPTYILPPFDTRLELGKSQSIKELKIFWLIREMDRSILMRVFHQIINRMLLDENIELIIAMKSTDPVERAEVQNIVNEVLEGLSLSEDFEISEFGQEVEEESDKNEVDALFQEERAPIRNIQFLTVHSEEDMLNALEFCRVVIDLSKEPDTYLQIASISSGLPQIHQVDTEYVTHQKNGWILTNIEETGDALRYYLVGLAHWNHALVESVAKIDEYSGQRLLNKWYNMLEEG